MTTGRHTAVDPRTPVLIGVGQVSQRPDDLSEAVEPLELMARACEAAASDCGVNSVLGRVDALRVVRGAWSYSDPGRLLAERFGADRAVTALTHHGGNTPQSLVNRSAREIVDGRHDVVLIVGGETIWTRRRARREGFTIPTTAQTEAAPDEMIGAELPMNDDFETSRGLEMPVHLYPVFESAIRGSRGETIEAHRDRISRLWEGFNRVAVANPHAWNRTPMTAAEIREPGPGNRMVGFPYTRAMNSNWFLDQAAALILCSAATARDLGVATDRWVFPWAGTDGSDTARVSERIDLHSSPAIRIAGRRCLELAGVGVEDLTHIDLYSCFPSAVQIAAAELAIPMDRPLTVTGGLTFAGGPLNNYVTHSIATMAGLLRQDPGSPGLCTANGGYVTKHAFGVYSCTPPAEGFRAENCQAAIDALVEPAKARVASDHVGDVTIEAYTVMFDREGADHALVALDARPESARRGPVARTWGRTSDPGILEALMDEEFIGRGARLTDTGEVVID